MVGGWDRTKFPLKGNIIIQWSDGTRASAGTLEISVDKKGMMKAGIRHMRLRIGLELVRKGLWLMLHGGRADD
jgi:hypothetical protein